MVGVVTINNVRRAFSLAFRVPAHVSRDSVLETGGTHLFAVRVDRGIPDRHTYPQTEGLWSRLELRLSLAYGYPVYFDSINACETRCYKVVPIANLLPIP